MKMFKKTVMAFIALGAMSLFSACTEDEPKMITSEGEVTDGTEGVVDGV